MQSNLTPACFERLMAPLAPFEARPHLAIGVSGGGDSMALVLLVDAWARARGGRVTGLSVDHGLRPGSAGEAATVAAWLGQRGVEHECLEWSGPKPHTGIQDAARQARYRLLEAWCRENGVLHLLIAHNLEDQAETVLLRLGRGSGPDGLAAMSAVRELTHCRVLRPLLGQPRQALRRFLEDAGQPWIDDPSNTDLRFARPRLRRRMAPDGRGDDQGLLGDAAALAESARRYGLARVVLERETDRLLATGCRFYGAGYAMMDLGILAAAPEDLGVRALGRVLSAIGGLAFPPRRARLERLCRELLAGSATCATLGRCQISVDGGGAAVFRERRNAPAATAHVPGAQIAWDRRFDIVFGTAPAGAVGGLRLRTLGSADWDALADDCPALAAANRLPGAALWGLPALADDRGVFAVPHLEYVREHAWPASPRPPGTGIDDASGFRRLRFRPALAASAAGFAVV